MEKGARVVKKVKLKFMCLIGQHDWIKQMDNRFVCKRCLKLKPIHFAKIDTSGHFDDEWSIIK